MILNSSDSSLQYFRVALENQIQKIRPPDDMRNKIPITCRVRRIFKRRAVNLRIMKFKRKISSLGSSPFSCPKFGEDQKKGLHSNLVRFLAQNKSLHRDSVRLYAQTFCPSHKEGGHAALLHTILRELYYLATQRGGHGTMPP